MREYTFQDNKILGLKVLKEFWLAFLQQGHGPWKIREISHWFIKASVELNLNPGSSGGNADGEIYSQKVPGPQERFHDSDSDSNIKTLRCSSF